MHTWIAQLPGDAGRKCVATALAMIKKETLPPTISSDFLVVTKEHLGEPHLQALAKASN